MRARIVIFITLLATSIPSFGANIQWLERSSDLLELRRAALDHPVYLRLIVGGDWGPEECYYEISTDRTLDQLLGENREGSLTLITFSRHAFATTPRMTSRLKVGTLFEIVEDLDRNDIFSLPKNIDRAVASLPRIKDPYNIVLFVKFGEREAYLYRDSTHDLLRGLHERIKNEWATQLLDSKHMSVMPGTVTRDTPGRSP